MLAGDLYITDAEILQDQVRSQELMVAYNTAAPGDARLTAAAAGGAARLDRRGDRDPAAVLRRLRLPDHHRRSLLRQLRAGRPRRRADHDRRRRADRAQRPAAHADPSGRARSAARQVGVRAADHHRRQRVARRRGDRAARRHDRRRHGGRCRMRLSRRIYRPGCWPSATRRDIVTYVLGPMTAIDQAEHPTRSAETPVERATLGADHQSLQERIALASFIGLPFVAFLVAVPWPGAAGSAGATSSSPW